MKVYFSPSNLWFIPEQFKEDGTYSDETWPDDAARLSDEDAKAYWKQTPPSGKMLGEINGKPVWVDIPAPTQEELTARAVKQKSSLISEAAIVIAPLADALAGGYIDDEDKPKLTEWQKYRYALTKVDPAKPVWPEKPSA